jgi:hypothetical protein
MKNWAILKPLIGLLFSRKFLVLFLAAAVSSGAAWASDAEEWIPLIVMLGAGLNGAFIAWEDAASKRAGNG